MSDQLIFNERNGPHGLAMENIFHVADCCRACLRIECSLTPTTTPDNDSIKFCDKLIACVSEVIWMKEGLPSLICTTCIERLRVAYDFRSTCIQSDSTLQRYISHLQDEAKQTINGQHSLTTPTKLEFSFPNSSNDNLPCIIEEPQNAEYLHLKHFLDNDEELTKNENLVDTTSPSVSPDINTVNVTFVDNGNTNNHQPLLENTHVQHSQQHQIHHHSPTQDHYGRLGSSLIQVQERQIKMEEQQLQFKSPRQVIKRTTGIQVRPPTPSTLQREGMDAKPFTCTVCGKNYRKNANLRIHMRTHTGEKPFECRYCEKRFYHSSHLREHIRRHTGEKPFQCAVCNKRFTIKGELTMHMKSHTGEKPYACTCCDRRCLTAADLKVHMRTHTGERPFECVTCGKKFASTYILNSHIKTHTGERPYSCSVCDKTFTQSSHLNVHMRKHTGEKVSCKLCDAKFTHSSQLTVHMREHTGKQPYKCTVCDKVCNYASELQTHMMKHTGEKFACVTCDKKFTSAAYLQEHTRTHTGENLSTCSICDRQFTRHQYLEKHMRTHTGERPYTCFTCGKKFTQSSSLKVHLRIHTGEKPYHCQVCDRRFTTSSDLSAHNKKHRKYINL
ncbi:hypothetical protein FQA39_LY16485 [Lamprigera yunnana]|nr:hypothetical protein FQA39_LY16485 [Lamprigera yunnana]